MNMKTLLIALAALGFVVLASVGVQNYLRMRHETASNHAIDDLRQQLAAQSAVDLVVADKEITSFPGYVLHITKRDGSSIEGIHIVINQHNGKKTTITADTGTVLPGSAPITVRLVLVHAKCETIDQDKTTRMIVEKMEIVL
jgi:hypothetical protein